MNTRISQVILLVLLSSGPTPAHAAQSGESGNSFLVWDFSGLAPNPEESPSTPRRHLPCTRLEADVLAERAAARAERRNRRTPASSSDAASPDTSAPNKTSNKTGPVTIEEVVIKSPGVLPENVAAARDAVTDQPRPPGVIGAITSAAAGAGLVSEADEILHAREARAARTTDTLQQAYRSSTAEELESKLRQSESFNRQLADELERSRASNEEARRLANAARDAADRDARAADWMHERRSAASTDRSFDIGGPVFGPSGGLPWSSSGAMNSLFGPPASSALTTDETARRLALLGGLPAAERERILNELGIDTETITLADGTTIRVPRNGGFGGSRETASAGGLGGGTSGQDPALPCASFLANALPSEMRRSDLSATDLITLWELRRSGIFPDGTRYSPTRQSLIKSMAPQFDAVDVYRANSRPVPGDVVLLQPEGRTLIAKNFDPSTLSIEALEVDPRTRRTRSVSLSLARAPGEMRPGIQILRIRRAASGNCEIRLSRTPPAT